MYALLNLSHFLVASHHPQPCTHLFSKFSITPHLPLSVPGSPGPHRSGPTTFPLIHFHLILKFSLDPRNNGLLIGNPYVLCALKRALRYSLFRVIIRSAPFSLHDFRALFHSSSPSLSDGIGLTYTQLLLIRYHPGGHQLWDTRRKNAKVSKIRRRNVSFLWAQYDNLA